jgi:PiT family inorganic phosphate transporter
VAGFAFQRISMRLLRGASPRVNGALRRGQSVTSDALAFAHGTNDAQKTMGIITMVLLSGGWIDVFVVPLWVKFAAATMLAAGAMTGGWRIMRTVGRGIFRVRPVHALSSQLASTTIILGNALVGGPVSTTHVVSSSIMGVGSATRSRAVRWFKVRDIALTWIITIPATTILSAVVLMILKWILGDAGVAHE